MEKKIHIVLYSLLFLGLSGIYYINLKEQKKPHLEKEKALQQSNSSITDEKFSSESLKIAYVNSDTVSKYYDYAKKVQSSLLNKRNSAERQIKGKYQAYEKLVKDFEKEAPIMGDREKLEKAQNIRALEQEILSVEQQLSDQLTQEEISLTQSYILKTNEYMQVIGAELGYDYVLSYRLGGPMLYADPIHDITDTIIKSLNSKYSS